MGAAGEARRESPPAPVGWGWRLWVTPWGCGAQSCARRVAAGTEARSVTSPALRHRPADGDAPGSHPLPAARRAAPTKPSRACADCAGGPKRSGRLRRHDGVMRGDAAAPARPCREKGGRFGKWVSPKCAHGAARAARHLIAAHLSSPGSCAAPHTPALCFGNNTCAANAALERAVIKDGS